MESRSGFHMSICARSMHSGLYPYDSGRNNEISKFMLKNYFKIKETIELFVEPRSGPHMYICTRYMHSLYLYDNKRKTDIS